MSHALNRHSRLRPRPLRHRRMPTHGRHRVRHPRPTHNHLHLTTQATGNRSDDTATVIDRHIHTPGRGERTPHVFCARCIAHGCYWGWEHHDPRAAAPCCSGSGPRKGGRVSSRNTRGRFSFLCVCVEEGFVLLGEIIYRDGGPGPGERGGWAGACLRGRVDGSSRLVSLGGRVVCLFGGIGGLIW